MACRWQDREDPDMRPRVRAHILRKLAEICETGQLIGSEKLHKLAADFEEGVFAAAESKMDYMRKIYAKMQTLDQKRQHLRKAAQDRQRRMQMVETMAGPIRPPSQLSNTQIGVQQYGPSDMMAMAPGQSSIAVQNQNPAVQLQPTNSAGCSQESVARLQGWPVARPNAQQNHLLGQNASRGICDTQQQTAQVMTRDHQGLGVNQHHMNSQRSQSVVADVANMNTGYPGGWNNQQRAGSQLTFKACEQEVLKKQNNLESRLITPAKQQSTINQQRNMHCPGPQTSGTMERAGEVDWREEMFEQSKLWKDAYFLELLELNRTVVITKIAEEQLQSLPKDKAEAYHRRSHLKHMMDNVLNFLQLQKSEIPETYRGLLPKFHNIIHKLLGFHGKIKGQNQGTSTGQSQDSHAKPQTIDLTDDTASFTDSKSNHQNWPGQPVNANISQMKQNVVTTMPPARQETRSNQLQGVRSPPPGGLQSPRQAQTAAGQMEDQVRSEAETPVAKKKPIDRLLDEVRSSSPAVLGSSVNSMKSVLIAMDSVPLPPWRGSNTKMKRSYDLTSSYSEFPLGSTDVSGSASSGELGAKRQKTQLQNARDSLLDEIEAINRTLIDTVICINSVTDGITLCNGGILIKLSYSAVSLVPSLKSHFVTSELQPLVMPVTLFVPTDYPASSPVTIEDGGGDHLRTKLSCISDTVDAAFQRALSELPEPRSLKEMASAWDACVRHAATEFACRHGGGTLGSMLGRWESCVGA